MGNGTDIQKDDARANEPAIRAWLLAEREKYANADSLAQGALDHFFKPEKHAEESADVMAWAGELFEGGPDVQGADDGKKDLAEEQLKLRTNARKPSKVENVNPKGQGWSKMAKASEGQRVMLREGQWVGNVKLDDDTPARVLGRMFESGKRGWRVQFMYKGGSRTAFVADYDLNRAVGSPFISGVNASLRKSLAAGLDKRSAVMIALKENESGIEDGYEEMAAAKVLDMAHKLAESVLAKRHDDDDESSGEGVHTAETDCPECEGEGNVMEGGKTRRCPLCGGRGKLGARAKSEAEERRMYARQEDWDMAEPGFKSAGAQLSKGVTREDYESIHRAVVDQAWPAALQNYREISDVREPDYDKSAWRDLGVALRAGAQNKNENEAQDYVADALGILEGLMGKSKSAGAGLRKKITKRPDVTPAEKARAGKEASKFADPTNKKYKLDTEKQVRAAMAYISMPKNAKKYEPAEVKAIKRRIMSAGKKFDIDWSKETAAETKKAAIEYGSLFDALFKRAFDEPDDDLGESEPYWREPGESDYGDNFREEVGEWLDDNAFDFEDPKELAGAAYAHFERADDVISEREMLNWASDAIANSHQNLEEDEEFFEEMEGDEGEEDGGPGRIPPGVGVSEEEAKEIARRYGTFPRKGTGEKSARAQLRKRAKAAVDGWEPGLFVPAEAVAVPSAEDIAKQVAVALAPQLEELKKANAVIDDLKGRLEYIERQPTPGGPMLRPTRSTAYGTSGGNPAVQDKLNQLEEEVMKYGRMATTEPNALLKMDYNQKEQDARARLEKFKRENGLSSK